MGSGRRPGRAAVRVGDAWAGEARSRPRRLEPRPRRNEPWPTPILLVAGAPGPLSWAGLPSPLPSRSLPWPRGPASASSEASGSGRRSGPSWRPWRAPCGKGSAMGTGPLQGVRPHGRQRRPVRLGDKDRPLRLAPRRRGRGSPRRGSPSRSWPEHLVFVEGAVACARPGAGRSGCRALSWEGT